MHRVIRGVGMLAVIAALAGCSSATTAGGSAPAGSMVSSSAAKGAPTPVDPDCASLYTGAVVGTVSAQDQLTQVSVCTGDGTGRMAVKTVTREQSEEILDSLAGLLAEPSATVDPDIACTAELRVLEDFVVTTRTGLVLAPAVPTDACGKPSLAVAKLLKQVASS